MNSAEPSHTMPADHAPSDESRLPGMRAWFLFLVLWLIGLAAVIQTSFVGYEAGDPAAMRLWLLAGMCFYLTLCNVFLPLPTAWVIMLLASDGVMLFEQPWLRILVVSAVGALATMVANLTEYHLLGFLLQFGWMRRIRNWRIYHWGVRWFDVSPFRTLTLIAFVPIPIDAVRWLAILRRYSRVRFGLAYFVGRLPRYALLAAIAVGFQLNTWQIIGIQIALVLLLAARLLWSAGMRLIGRGASVEDEVPVADAAAEATATEERPDS